MPHTAKPPPRGSRSRPWETSSSTSRTRTPRSCSDPSWSALWAVFRRPSSPVGGDGDALRRGQASAVRPRRLPAQRRAPSTRPASPPPSPRPRLASLVVTSGDASPIRRWRHGASGRIPAGFLVMLESGLHLRSGRARSSSRRSSTPQGATPPPSRFTVGTGQPVDRRRVLHHAARVAIPDNSPAGISVPADGQRAERRVSAISISASTGRAARRA